MCEHGDRPRVIGVEAPAVHVFKPYVDEHISVTGKPVEIRSESQRKALMRSQWDGDWQAKLEERPPIDLKRRRERLMDTKNK